MTISDHLNEQVLRLDLEHLSDQEREWLHMIKSLFMWAYIAKAEKGA